MSSFVAVACDDGKVRKLGGGVAVVACVAYRELRPSGLRLGLVHVDGLDATSVVGELAREIAAGSEGLLMVDSITIAGFNVISLPGISRISGLRAVAVYTYEPDIARLEGPLRAHFSDAELRLRVLEPIKNVRRVETPRGPLYVVPWGLRHEEAGELLALYQVYTRVPEPIRVAHRVASEVSEALELGL